MQLGVRQFYDRLPNQEEMVKKGKEKIKLINEDFRRHKEEMEEKRRLIESRKH